MSAQRAPPLPDCRVVSYIYCFSLECLLSEMAAADVVHVGAGISRAFQVRIGRAHV